MPGADLLHQLPGTGQDHRDHREHMVAGSTSLPTATSANAPSGTATERRMAYEFAFQGAWLELLSSLYGYRILHLAALDSRAQLTGYLPLAVISSVLTGKRIVSLPFADYVPILAADEDALGDLLDQSVHLAGLERARYLELRTGQHPVLERRPELSASRLYVRYLLPLTSDVDSVLARVKSRTRGQIRKAMRDGVQVRWGLERRDIRLFYQLHLQTRTRKHGMPTQPLAYFLALWDAFAASGQIRLLLGEYKGNCIAAAILQLAGGTVRPSYVASDQRYLDLNATRMMEWEAIAWACENGYEIWDFGRTARDNEGLKQYKRSWGTTEDDLTYYYFPQAAGLAATSESSRKYHVLTAAWRHLPLPLAGMLGERLYRHLG